MVCRVRWFLADFGVSFSITAATWLTQVFVSLSRSSLKRTLGQQWKKIAQCGYSLVQHVSKRKCDRALSRHINTIRSQVSICRKSILTWLSPCLNRKAIVTLSCVLIGLHDGLLPLLYPVKRNTRSAPLAVRTSDRGSDQSQLLAICALIDFTKEALPSSFLIEAFWVSAFTSGTFIWCSSLWLSRIPCSGTCVTTTPDKMFKLSFL